MPTDRDALFRIQQPCPLASPTLLEDGHCAHCDRTVHDLSALTRREATRLRHAHQRRGERLCGIVRQDREGRVQFQPGLLDRLTRHLRAGLLQPPAPARAAHAVRTAGRSRDDRGPQEHRLHRPGA